MKITIVIPAHNEEANIEKVIESIERNVHSEHEIVIVDDHCIDKTADIVKGLVSQYQNNIRLVKNDDEPGFANALKTGFSNTRSDIIVPVMADLCDDPQTINRMYDKIIEGFDIVCASRYMPGGRKIGGPKLKGFFSRFVGLSLHFLIGIPTHDIANSFKMYKRGVIDTSNIESEGFEISVELPLKAFFADYKITEVPTTWVDRKCGESKFHVLKQGSNYLKLYFWALWKGINSCLIKKK